MSCWESCTDLHHTQVITNSMQGFVSWRNKDFTRCSFIKHCSSASHTFKSRHHFKIQVCYSVARATYRENRIFPNLLAPPNSPVGRAGLLVILNQDEVTFGAAANRNVVIPSCSVPHCGTVKFRTTNQGVTVFASHTDTFTDWSVTPTSLHWAIHSKPRAFWEGVEKLGVLSKLV